MRRCNESVISPIFVFTVTFVMISHVVSSYRTTRHYKNTVSDEDSGSSEIEMNSSIFISRLLRTSPSVLRFTERHRNEFYELNQFPHATFQEHTSKPNLRIRLPTSCGQITCDSVPGYPEDIITEIARSTNLIPDLPSPKGRHLPRATFPVPRSLELSKKSTRHPNDHDIHPPERVRNCSKLVEEIIVYPRESVNEKDQPKLLVSLPEYNIFPVARECRGPKACIDATTPERKVWKCENDYVLRYENTFNPEERSIERQKMKIPNGCKCKLHDA